VRLSVGPSGEDDLGAMAALYHEIGDGNGGAV
jgi:hypothetical protein